MSVLLSNARAPRARRPLAAPWPVVAVLACLPWLAVAQALPAPSPQARQALEALLGSLGPGETLEVAPAAVAAAGAGVAPAPVAAAPAVPVRQRVQTRRGEPLDALIRRTLGDMPIKETALRGVFMDLNPGAFTAAAVPRAAADAQVLVPTVADIRSHLLRAAGVAPVAGPASVSAAPVAGAAPATAPAAAAPPGPSTPPERPRWVRFP